MIDIGEKKYKTYFPDSMISNTILYKQASRNLNSFLKNNFSNNSSYSKFPIKKPYLKKKQSLKRQITIKKERPKSSGKHNLNYLIDSLRHENYKSYNFYDNTKGPLQSTKYKTINSTIAKSKINNIENTYSNNDSNIKTNNFLLSFNSRPKSSKTKYPSSNISLYKINRKKEKNRTNLEKNKKINFSSLSNYVLSKRNNISKNKSTPLTPTSTRYKSKTKQNFVKEEYYSLSLNNSSQKFSRNKSNKSVISFRSNNRSKKNRKKMKILNNFLSNKSVNKSLINKEQDQREFHQKLYLNNLYSQIKLFEVSNGFEVNEDQIKSNLMSPFKFQRNLFIKEVKRASNHNDYFYNKYPCQSEKFEKIHNNKKHRVYSPNQRIYYNSKKLMKNINRLSRKLNISQNLIRGLNIKSKTYNLTKLIELVVPIKHNIRDMDEQIKDETINYQKNIGKFFIYKGSGVFSGHLSSILRGDKIVKQTIKFENL